MKSYSSTQIELDSIFNSFPKKNNEKYISQILYNEGPLLLKTSKLNICNITKKKITFFLEENTLLKSFIERLESFFKNKITQHSFSWFKKDFDIKDIEKTFISSIKDNMLTVYLSKNSTIFNSVGELDELSNVKKNFLSNNILFIKSLCFSKENCGLLIEVFQLKYYNNNKIPSLEYCIISDNESENEDDINYIEEIEEEVKEEVNEIETVENKICNLEEEVENVEEEVKGLENKEEISEKVEELKQETEELEKIVSGQENENYFKQKLKQISNDLKSILDFYE